MSHIVEDFRNTLLKKYLPLFEADANLIMKHIDTKVKPNPRRRDLAL
jgi:hypothetical protein